MKVSTDKSIASAFLHIILTSYLFMYLRKIDVGFLVFFIFLIKN